MNNTELKRILTEPDRFEAQAFDVLREIAHRYAAAEIDDDPQVRQEARQLIIRALERREQVGTAKPVLDALLARVGLYPYLDDPDALSLADRLAFEAHRPLVQPRDEFVFHSMQAQVYARLMDGDTVILTAPTSFGKTLIVDALVVSGKYDNIAVVVPTIALIDEVRRRLFRLNQRHGLDFRVTTHPGQTQGERNIFVFTQERVLEEEDFPPLGIAVIDEMYKLSLNQDADRGPLLNQALYKLRKLASQLYLLGPNVGTLSELPADFEHRFIPSDDSTVAVDVVPVARTGDDREDLLRICKGLDEATLIFVSSPKRAHEVARWLVEGGIHAGGLPNGADWLASTYHPDWVLAESLRAGIGIHHGRVPRAIAHYIVSAFNQEKLRFLVCTSTLIEGVNTTAKNIVVLDDKIDRRKYDLFTFKNIQGRSGRMFKHFIGRVFLFNEAPQDPLPNIEIPVMSQPDDTPVELLLAINEEDLTPTSRMRIQRYLDQDVLPVEVLRTNAGVDLDAQLELAEALGRDPHRWAGQLAWRRFPQYDQLLAVAELIFEYFSTTARRWGAWSAKQLTLLIWRSYNNATPRDLITQQLDYAARQARMIDDVVLDVLTFQRNGLTFGFPKYLRVVDNVQQAVLGRAGARTGDYSQFAAAAEGGFLPVPLAALDEYGLPLEVARKLSGSLLPRGADDSLDAVLERLRVTSDHMPQLTTFERELLREAKEDL
jgi:DEAD/DEAH box helicase